jgi:putative sigma-54 modulation protein
MEVHFTGRHYEIAPELREYVARKLEKLTNFEEKIGEARVILTAESYRQIAEVKLTVRGKEFVGTGESADMYASVDQVAEKLLEQLKRFKGRRIERGRRDGARGAGVPAGEITLRETHPAPVALSVDEALAQLDDEGGEVLVFENSANRKTTVLYRRDDGSYGLIEPAG